MLIQSISVKQCYYGLYLKFNSNRVMLIFNLIFHYGTIHICVTLVMYSSISITLTFSPSMVRGAELFVQPFGFL